ncbi:copper resistance protein CopC [Streptomyces sp. TR06-5]|uniref:copper resistance CopC/CopD family protein n=1 Tax=Streptomyces sp. TR06-5 TaxID=3385976 RepID=UPI00399F2085
MQSTTAARPRPVRALGTALAALTALGALLLGAAGPAVAHSSLTGSSPAAGAVVDRTPDAVTLTFSEAVRPDDDSFRVLGPDGSRADTGEQVNLCSGDTIRFGTLLRPGLSDGTYTVAWHVVSADGHPVSGAFTFSVGTPSATAVALPEQAAGGGTAGVLHALARYAAYAGFTLLIGTTTLLLTCWREGTRHRTVRRLLRASWLTAVAATLVRLLLRHPYTGSGDLTDALDPGGLAATVQTTVGTALVCRLLLLGAAAFFLVLLLNRPPAAPLRTDDGPGAGREDAHRRLFLLAGAGLATALAATWALAEHALTGPQSAAAQVSHLAHLLAVAVWLGGLTTVLAVLTRPAGLPLPASAVRRFSRYAAASVAVLAATGLYQSWRQTGSVDALTGTAYGRLLLLKTGLVLVLVLLALLARRWTFRLMSAADRAAPAGEEAAATAAPARAAALPTAHPAGTGGTGSTGGGDSPDTADGPPAAAPVHDPVRAAQLARQQAAVRKARVRRDRDADPRRVGLRRAVLAEALVGAVVLAVTVQLTGTEPARTAAASAALTAPSAAVPDRPLDLSLPFDTGGARRGKGTVAVALDPGRTGRNTLRITATDPGGAPLDLPEVRLALTLPSQDLGPLRYAPQRTGPGAWRSRRVVVPAPGDWTLAVTVRSSDIDQVTLTETVTLG